MTSGIIQTRNVGNMSVEVSFTDQEFFDFLWDDLVASSDKEDGVFDIHCKDGSYEELRHPNTIFPKDCQSWADLDSRWNKTHHVLPVYMYRHSGDTFSLKSFNCAFDSGRVGSFLMKRRRGLTSKKVQQLAQSRVSLLDAIVNGMLFSYEVKDECGEPIDSANCFLSEEQAMEEGIALAQRLTIKEKV